MDEAEHGPAAQGAYPARLPGPPGHVPAWRRVTDGEERLPATLAVVALIVLQTRIPDRLMIGGRWALPALEALVAATLVLLNPRRITRQEAHVRVLGLTLVGLASLANGWAAVQLVVGIVEGRQGTDAVGLITAGCTVWLANVVVFAIWYWELDRGGPAARALAVQKLPDFVFPQMTSRDLADPEWEPLFLDYLYLAFTNAMAFSPTDTMPFSRWSKMIMLLQSLVSLGTGALIIARAVNILPG